ncbi:MAG: ABC transporter substrate-binding protein [Acidobacteriota bacterium]
MIPASDRPLAPSEVARRPIPGGFSPPLFRAVLLVLSLLPGALACGPPPRKADLIVAVEQEPSSLDPRIGSDVAADRAFRLLYRGLFAVGTDFSPRADLAETWSYEGPRRLRIVLRAGVRFSDGRPVRARDAAYTIRSILRDEPPSFRKGDLDCIESAEAQDDLTLVLSLKEPRAALLSALNVGILPEGADAEGFVPVGCGPYRLRSWDHGQWLLFEANPYASPPPSSPTLAFKVVPDPVVRSLEMRRGTVDLVVNDLPPDALARFVALGYRVWRTPGANFAYVGFNCTRPPLDRAEVRRALSLSLDRPSIIRHVLRGYAREAAGLLPPEHWASAPLPPPGRDAAAAEALLDRAGFPRGRDGVRFRMTYKTSDNKISRQIASVIAENLGDLGVLCETQWLEWGTFYGDVKRGDFDAFGLTWVGVTDPDGLRLRYASWAVPPAGFNRGRYTNPELDGLLAAGSKEMNPLLRRPLYVKAQEILAREAPAAPLWHPDSVCVAQGDVEGVALPSDGNFSFLSRVRRSPAKGPSGSSSHL